MMIPIFWSIIHISQLCAPYHRRLYLKSLLWSIFFSHSTGRSSHKLLKKITNMHNSLRLLGWPHWPVQIKCIIVELSILSPHLILLAIWLPSLSIHLQSQRLGKIVSTSPSANLSLLSLFSISWFGQTSALTWEARQKNPSDTMNKLLSDRKVATRSL